MVKQQISNLRSRVRFSYPAPHNFSECGAVWLAHLVWDQGVQGSNPCTPTILEGLYESS